MIPLDAPWLSALGWTLIHSLWQGTLVGLAAWGALRLLARQSAQTRYLAACAGLLLLLALPVATFLILLPSLSPSSPPASLALVPGWRARLSSGLPLAGLFWMTGVALMGARLLAGWAWVQRLRWAGASPADSDWQTRLRTLARRLHLRVEVRLLRSWSVEAPLLLGWIRPVILVPVAAFSGLSPQALEAVLAHELAHVRRYDYLVNLVQSLVEALLFYHPAAWWLSRQIRAERENASDDLAISVLGDPIRYARALADLEDLRSQPSLPPHLALAATGGTLMTRIRRILTPPMPPASATRSGLLAALAITTLGACTAWGFAEDQKPAEQKRIYVQEGDKRIEARMKGDVKLDPKAEGGVVLGEGATLDLTVREAPQRRQITLKKSPTGVTRTLTENGVEKPLDKAGEAWFQQQLQALQAAEAKAEKSTDGKAGDRNVRIEVREEGDTAGKPRVFVYQQGTGDHLLPEFGAGGWTERNVFVTPFGDLNALKRDGLKLDVEVLRKHAEELRKSSEGMRKLSEEDLKRIQEVAKLHVQIPKVRILKDGHLEDLDRRIQEEIQMELGKGGISRNIVIRRNQDPKAEAEAVKRKIEELQKRLKELEAEARKAPPAVKPTPVPPKK
jgi:beta-lactamase regulating signal transducer with metallopeptidase domain